MEKEDEFDGSYQSALEFLFSAEERVGIKKNLSKWRHEAGEVERIVKNIEGERHLMDRDAWHQVLSIFLVPMADYLDHFKAVCGQFKFKGREIKPDHRPKRVGKVIPRRQFDVLMMNHHKLKDEEVDELIINIRKGDYKQEVKYAEIKLGKGVTWVTWNQERNTDDPFTYIRPIENKIGVRCLVLYHNLGLLQRFKTYTQLVFSYNVPEKLVLRYPTFIDACTYEYFSPTDHNSPHGFTLSYPKELAVIDNVKDWSIKPRPEAVHGDLLLVETESLIEECH